MQPMRGKNWVEKFLAWEDSLKFLLMIGLFVAVYSIPFQSPRISGALIEALLMLQEYVREHVLFCLVPAFFIAGAIGSFVSKEAVIRYFGPGARKLTAYVVAAVSGTVLAVCSCTVLPLFAGIYKRGAGLGPAVAFLYSGPAINVLAIILTARVLGWQMGLARTIGAVLSAIVIGLVMAFLYRDEEKRRLQDGGREELHLLRNAGLLSVLVLILVFAAWGEPAEQGFWLRVYAVKWHLTIVLLFVLGYMLKTWFSWDERMNWFQATWEFAQQILPMLFTGVLIAGALMGRPGADAGLIPARLIAPLLGGNSLLANITASVLGALMYFATLTEVPIIQGLVGLGMGKGPALALLLAGPALSLPSMLVIRSVLGTKKTLTFVLLVILMATVAGMVFGA
ncbi:MAG: permease [Limnochordia bacterium]|jgi:uncharacterized membrane protein YraQ (UPF0718 family)